jgi:hypothetical protein
MYLYAGKSADAGQKTEIKQNKTKQQKMGTLVRLLGKEAA